MSLGSLSRFTSNIAPPQLEELKLSHILNGETCPPISFGDFAAYVAHQEYTTENLLFVVWYRNYRARFDDLDRKTRASIPVPSTRLGDRYAPFAYLDKALAERKANGEPLHPEGISFDQLLRVESKLPSKHSTKCVDGVCHPLDRKPSLLSRLTTKSPPPKSKSKPILHPTLHPTLPPPGTVFTPPESQPMRAEAQRAFATFLRKGGSRELGISDELREFAKECLSRSTAPEAFLPIYEEIYNTVETQSLPRFLSSAKRNINKPKELFWYAVGFADLLIGIAIFTLLTLLLPSHPFEWRILRLVSTIFVSFGVMQAYSAYRGFCSQVWGRSNRQVRPWEMDELHDEEIRLEAMPCCAAQKADSVHDSVGESKGVLDHRDDIGFVTGEELAGGVHALSDLGRVMDSPPSPVSVSVSVSPAPVDPLEPSQKQLEIRLATVKAPAPHEAFPFVNDVVPPIPPAPAPAPFQPSPSHPEESTSGSGSDHELARRTSRDLSTLLINLRRASAQPSVMGRERSRSSANDDMFTLNLDLDKRPRVFGPERLIEDERVRKMMSSIVRDILVVGGIVGVIWVALCLAVPCKGLLE